jgi:hypothetical protein
LSTSRRGGTAQCSWPAKMAASSFVFIWSFISNTDSPQAPKRTDFFRGMCLCQVPRKQSLGLPHFSGGSFRRHPYPNLVYGIFAGMVPGHGSFPTISSLPGTPA